MNLEGRTPTHRAKHTANPRVTERSVGPAGAAAFPGMLACRRDRSTASAHVTVRRTAVHRPASRRIDEPTLLQFVVLSMLLHIFAIVLFGSTGRGGTSRDEEPADSLDVTLHRAAPEAGAGFRVAPSSPQGTPASRAPLSERERIEAPAQGERASGPSPRSERSAIEPAVPSEALPVEPEGVPRLNPAAPEEVDKPLRPALLARPEAKIEARPQRLEPVAPPPIEQPVAPFELPSRAIPIAPGESLQRFAPPAIERDLTRPAELPRRALPAAPSTPLERLAPPTAERELAAPIAPLEERPLAPGVPTVPLEPVAPPATEHPMAAPAELPSRSRAAAPALPIEAPRPVPEALPSESAPSVPAGAPPVLAPETAPAAPRTSPARTGTPERDEDIFKPRREAPGEAPTIDLEAAKKRAVREMAREGAGSPGALPFPLPIPETKTKEAKAMEKAVKPDCRTAYAGMGLLAVPALVASAITDEGCRW